MQFKGAVEANFAKRMNRFLATAILEGREVHCFFPNPGRLRELLIPTAPVLLIQRSAANRKTHYDMATIRHQDCWISIDSRVPNILMKDALARKEIHHFKGYGKTTAEYSFGRSRFDFFLENDEKCLLEVKSCTLVRDGTALFPDAPTARGTRHLEDLMKAKMEGYRACIAFVVQRGDARRFSPNSETDEPFSNALKKAARKGVEVLAYSCDVSRDGVELDGELEVVL